MDFEYIPKISDSTVQPSAALAGSRSKQTHGNLVCHSQESAQRAQIEDFVRGEFLVHFNAHVRHFMPMLLALHDSRGGVRAAVGYRSAASERLFLETYTREPIEAVLLRRFGAAIARERIVEIGSLSCRGAAAAIDIVTALIPFLLRAGFSWAVFTGADTVMKVFWRLRLSPHVLCTADPALLGKDRDDWGTYYDHHPKVMTGRLCEAIDTLEPAKGLQ